MAIGLDELETRKCVENNRNLFEDVAKGYMDAKDVYNALQTKFPSQIFNTKIRENTKVSEAPGYRCTIFEHDPSCAGAEDYLQLAREIGGIKPGSKWK